MYNRYIPQSDGTFQKSQVSESPCLDQDAPTDFSCSESGGPRCGNRSAGSFLRQLIPPGLDTGDLLVILLLLLIAGDSAENRNTALLTLALYLFL